ncbi:MAG: nucleotide exchange factor GrpE [Gemmatimonadota bacterium]|nr:MAG: nucleotide exchange factor GrpE [Gemmatimonadota bacterium]
MGPRKRAKKTRDKAVDDARETAVPESEAEVLAAEERDEPAILEESEETAAPTPDEVIATLSSELEALEDRHLRLVAEFDNFRKRTVKERSEQAQRAQGDLARQLLESLDDLARVSELGSSDHDAAAILEGVQLVEKKLQRALEQLGLKRIEAVGQRFDPELHEAMVTVATEDPEEDETVSQEFAKGYTFGNTLLRPSRVAVKMYRPAEEGGAVEPGESEDGS